MDKQPSRQAEDEKRWLDILLKNPATTEIMNVIPRAMERYREAVEHLGNIRPEQVSEARERLKEITGGDIILKPFDGDGLTAEVHGNYASLIASSSIMLVAGACNGHYRTQFVLKQASGKRQQQDAKTYKATLISPAG